MNSHQETPLVTLSEHDWREVCQILLQYLPDYTVLAFGSRVAGNSKPYSDLDLVIVTEQPLSIESMATIKDAFDESDLTVRVDIVDWAATGEIFREIIQRQYVVIQQAGDANCFN